MNDQADSVIKRRKPAVVVAGVNESRSVSISSSSSGSSAGSSSVISDSGLGCQVVPEVKGEVSCAREWLVSRARMKAIARNNRRADINAVLCAYRHSTKSEIVAKKLDA